MTILLDLNACKKCRVWYGVYGYKFLGELMGQA